MNVVIQASHPTTRDDGAPLPSSELRGWRVETKLAAATDWTPTGPELDASSTSQTIQNVPKGAWQYRAFWIDTDAQESDPSSVVDLAVGAAKPSPGSITATPSG